MKNNAVFKFFSLILPLILIVSFSTNAFAKQKLTVEEKRIVLATSSHFLAKAGFSGSLLANNNGVIFFPKSVPTDNSAQNTLILADTMVIIGAALGSLDFIDSNYEVGIYQDGYKIFITVGNCISLKKSKSYTYEELFNAFEVVPLSMEDIKKMLEPKIEA
jgi:hypothetical protein